MDKLSHESSDDVCEPEIATDRLGDVIVHLQRDFVNSLQRAQSRSRSFDAVGMSLMMANWRDVTTTVLSELAQRIYQARPLPIALALPSYTTSYDGACPRRRRAHIDDDPFNTLLETGVIIIPLMPFRGENHRSMFPW